MSFPIITEQVQYDFEKQVENDLYRNEYIPATCGILGRACRRIGRKANRVPCISCSLAKFAQREVVQCQLF